ncbi:alpha/beta hydrolase [Ruegeria arenilitoris]|uniref:alpha/beta hydrolase n=1 Tax=Ruegeria arenilitoris TaxID=1173585 RepID=UPI001C2C4310|nr:alpha/beta hydrolase [Ruegeria arenilitoris]
MTQSTRISLQNTPTRKGVAERAVSFDSNGNTLKGTLYTPENASAALPAVIVTGAWTTVKEQMPGTYARELAARGFAALAFDFTGWGESDGTPRFVEDPSVKTAEIRTAAAFLISLDEVDSSRISGLGVCASSGYMAAAVADDANQQKVALVAPWMHDPAMAEGIYGGPEMAASLIAASEADGAADTVLLGASTTDENAVMYQAPYYTEEDRGLIPAYDNKFSVASWKPWLTYDAQASADRLTKPMLMVGSPSIALPAGATAYEARTKAPLEKLWLGEDVTQFDFYDRKDAVTAASDAVADFLNA